MQTHQAQPQVSHGIFESFTKAITGRDFNSENQQKGWEKRKGVGRLEHPANNVIRQMIPLKKLFFSIPYSASGNQIGALVNPIENVLAVYLQTIKITGLAAANDVVVLSLNSGNSNFKTETMHNVNTVYDDVLFIEKQAASTSVLHEYSEPLLIDSRKSANSWDIISTKVKNLAGDDLTFTNMYIWLLVETINW